MAWLVKYNQQSKLMSVKWNYLISEMYEIIIAMPYYILLVVNCDLQIVNLQL